MNIQIEPYIEDGKTIMPSITLSLNTSIVGIYTDVKKIDYVMQALKSVGYIHPMDEGHYERLTIEESFRYYCALFDRKDEVEELLSAFGFSKQRKVKVKDLTKSERNKLHFLRAFLQTSQLLIIEEPLQQMDEDCRVIVTQLMMKWIESGRFILLLSNNLEDILISTGEIYRVDQTGCHPLDFADDSPPTKAEEDISFKIEKIQTKKNDKIILFNPPEIDFIESMDGEVLVNVAGDAYNCGMTLQDLEKKLKGYGFYRCHRSYIVNLQKVREIITWTKNSYSLKLNVGEGTVIPLSRAKISELKEYIGIS
ncbi:LytTR family transcriptional regulator DNA-binding domain-containing protein [Lysinibacillus sp. 54212]|uniref:LytTR family transcriptional regulator DNA-binding domain-containing protein n=1 Tax=Lysinibacillus sp. 54212 TaxID=3119829 RepID=UPI002FC79D57